MSILLEWISGACLLFGGFFVICGSFGVLRFPDFYTRVHAAGVTETAGVGFILLGLLIEAGPGIVAAKLLIILVFLFFTNPTAAHALAKAARHGELEPLLSPRGEQSSNS